MSRRGSDGGGLGLWLAWSWAALFWLLFDVAAAEPWQLPFLLLFGVVTSYSNALLL